MITIRSAYSYDRRQNSLDSGLKTTEPSLAQQSFKEECDINTLVMRFGLTGTVPDNWAMPGYIDATGLASYQEMMQGVIDADAAFMELPSGIRERFANDPQRLVEFLTDEANRDEAIKLGLVKAPVVAPPVVPMPVRIIADEPGA